MATIAWTMWISILVGVIALFTWLWRFALKIEIEETEEVYWRDYFNEWRQNIDAMWSYDGESAHYQQQQYDKMYDDYVKRFWGGR